MNAHSINDIYNCCYDMITLGKKVVFVLGQGGLLSDLTPKMIKCHCYIYAHMAVSKFKFKIIARYQDGMGRTLSNSYLNWLQPGLSCSWAEVGQHTI